MIRRALLILLTASSIALALGSALSSWHPFYWSHVRKDRLTIMQAHEGWVHCYNSVNWTKWSSIGPGTQKSFALPFVGGVSSSNDGSRSAWIHGLRLAWCRQPTGFQAYGVDATLFDLALLALLYPALNVAFAAARRVVRRRRGRCLECAYDLTGNVSGSCPECGTEIERP